MTTVPVSAPYSCTCGSFAQYECVCPHTFAVAKKCDDDSVFIGLAEKTMKSVSVISSGSRHPVLPINPKSKFSTIPVGPSLLSAVGGHNFIVLKILYLTLTVLYWTIQSSNWNCYFCDTLRADSSLNTICCIICRSRSWQCRTTSWFTLKRRVCHCQRHWPSPSAASRCIPIECARTSHITCHPTGR